MTLPWTSAAALAPLRAARAHDDSDGELAPRTLVTHYERAGYDVLAVTDHWTAATRRRPTACSCSRASSSTASCPTTRDGHVLALASTTSSRRSRASGATSRGRPPGSAAHGGVAYLAHPYWTGVTPGTLELPESVSGHRGLQRRLRARDRPRRLGGALGRAARGGRLCSALATDDSHHPGFDSGLAWTWVRGRADTRRCARGASQRLLLRDDRTTNHVVGLRGRRRGGGMQPCRSRSRSSTGISSGASVTPGGSAKATAARSSRRTRRARHRRRLDAAGNRDLRPARSDRRPRPKGVDEPRMAVSEPARRGASRARAARPTTCSSSAAGSSVRDRERGGAPRPPRRPRRPGDFGGATSSASSKLIHGGLRYLRLGDVKLVREAHTERRALLRVVAPHLVRRIPFLFPVYRGGPYRPATIQAGLWTYSTLAGEKLGGLVRPERARRSVPPLRLEGLRGCGVYQDAWTHDERLCLANVTAAAEAARRCSTTPRSSTCAWSPAGSRARRSRPDRRRGGLGRGAASSTRRALARRRCAGWRSPASSPYGRLSKGVHVTLPLDEPWSARADDPARPGSRDVRVPVGGDAPARHDGHALRGRPRRRRGDGGRRRPRPRRGGRGGRPAPAPPGARALDYAGLRVLSAQRRRDRRRPARDGVPRGHGRDAHASPAAS